MNYQLFTSKLINQKDKLFYLILTIITILAFGVRVINIKYASLWSDELYSMLSIHPDNSFYEMLYMQRKDQPPLYFIVLRLWTTLFGFNDLNARMLSVLIGTLSTLLIGLVNRYVFSNKIGLISSFIVAFSFTQIEHSLEARFYGLLFLLIVLSYFTYYKLKEYQSWGLIVLHSIICSMIVLTHYFGFMIVMVYGVFDAISLIKDFNRDKFVKICVHYILILLLLFPWFYWSFSSIQSVKTHIMRTIDVGSYLLYNLKYQTLFLIIIFFTSITGLVITSRIKEQRVMLLIFQVVALLVVPYIFSIIKYPLLVPRYSFAMAPAMYSIFAVGFTSLMETTSKWGWKLLFSIILLTVFSFDGIYYSLFDKKKLMKEPWREMSQWLITQKDIRQTPVYSVGYMLKKKFTLYYYLPGKEISNLYIDSISCFNTNKFYLVETNAHDIAPASVKLKLDSAFISQKINFGIDEYGKGGTITIYKKNNETRREK